ncbi:MAG: prolyl oligopeptidase family serine peptidase [bacterium]|nr:prolyl oligopeptidase family serine peptidase [bacterium]
MSLSNISTKTKEEKFNEKLHGIEVSDPYRWLENTNSSEVGTWINEQNNFSASILKKLPARKKVAARLKELFTVDSMNIPSPKKGYYFSIQRKAHQDLGVLYVQKGLYGKKRVLIDGNKLSKDKTTVLSNWSVSKDGKLLAYALSEKGNDQYTVYVLDVLTGKKLKDYIPADVYPARSGIGWNSDGSGFWYTRCWGKTPKGEEKLHQKVYYHKLGTDFKKDQMIFGEDLNKFAFPSFKVSTDGRYLLISVTITTEGARRNDLYIKDLQLPNSTFIPIIKDVRALFRAWIHRGQIFIFTNHKAPNWKLMRVSVLNGFKGISHWETVIPAGKHAIEHLRTIKGMLFVKTLENLHSVMRKYTLNGTLIGIVPLPDFGTIVGSTGEAEGEEVFFGFSSFTTRFQVFRLDLKTNRLKIFNEMKSGIDPKKFVTKQVWFASKDKTKIPMFLIYKKGLVLNGKNPTIIYGYGGFSISQRPEFNVRRIPFIERGGIYAIACIRGGGEFGDSWHQAGTRQHKQNSFNDFIAAAEWLIKNKYTHSQHMAAFGWSNGGLLMGAMITQRPDLFKAIVVGAPVMDMLRFHKFDGGAYWISDYGNPDIKKDFSYLLKYSPYHNIKAGMKYPATLILTAEGDDRVHPMHAYKFVARLQNKTGSDNPIILRVERKAGHGGAASISNTIEQYADVYAFVFWQLGMKA